MRGAPSYHDHSYFGVQAAASLMQLPSPNIPTGAHSLHAGEPPYYSDATQSFCNERGAYTHVWELVGYIPRRKAVVDRLIEAFLKDLNPVFDSVHEETFRAHYQKFYDRKAGSDDLETIDLRWLSLLFIVLAYAELLVCPPVCSIERQRESEEASLHFYWAARKAVVIAPTFSGESADIVRAGIMITRYLVHLRRTSESWLTASFATRMAQAQGMHIDGASWNLPRKVVEVRRRLWATLYNIDRTVCLALGRPYTINDKHCMKMEIPNVWVDDMTAEEASFAKPQDISDPTQSVFYQYQQYLTDILGEIHDQFYSLTASRELHTSYDKVMLIDRALLDWKENLPAYFRLNAPDTSMDAARPFLPWQRRYLHGEYHFARITLHRPYVLLPSMTDRFHYSREACVSSACADLAAKMDQVQPSMADRLKLHVCSSQVYNSALVLGIIVVQRPFERRSLLIVEELQAYCARQKADRWVNEFERAEIKIIELCIARVRESHRDRNTSSQHQCVTPTGMLFTEVGISDSHEHQPYCAQSVRPAQSEGISDAGPDVCPVDDTIPYTNFDMAEHRRENWWDLAFAFPEPYDIGGWNNLLEDLQTFR